MHIAKEGWPFILPPVAAAGALWTFGRYPWVGASLGLAAFVTWFFRDPARGFEGPVDLVVAPADGVVTAVDSVLDQEVGPGRMRRIVTFLSAFNVHVQRAPVSGEVIGSRYKPGRKVAAFRSDAGEVNEYQLTVLRREEGEIVGVRQLAGLVARRVVPYLAVGDCIDRGARLGIIKFGSRVDLMIPESYEVLVSVGDRLVAGETAVAMPTDPSSPPPDLDDEHVQ